MNEIKKADQQLSMKVSEDVKELYERLDNILGEGNDLTRNDKLEIILTAAEKNLTKSSASKFVSNQEIKEIDYHVKRIGEVYLEILKRTEANEKARQEELEEVKTSLVNENERIKAKFESMKEEIQYRTEERDGIVKINDQLSEENRNIRNALSDKERIISTLEGELQEKKQQLVDLKTTAIAAQEAEEKAIKENTSLKTQNQELLEKLRNLENELKLKDSELQRTEKDINIKNAQLESKEIALEGLRREHKETIKEKDATIGELNKNLLEAQKEAQKIGNDKDKEIAELNRKFFEQQQEMQNKIIALMEKDKPGEK